MYFWAHGLHVNVQLDDERSCILVIMGANEGGHKESLAVSDGYRESKASCERCFWTPTAAASKKVPSCRPPTELWAALREVYPGCEEQTCWFHKSGNVLDKMPKAVQSKAKATIHDMW